MGLAFLNVTPTMKLKMFFAMGFFVSKVKIKCSKLYKKIYVAPKRRKM